MKRIGIILISMILLVNSSVIPAWASEENRAENAFRLLAALNISAEEASDEPITRAQFIVTAESLLLNGIDTGGAEIPFTDVDLTDEELTGAVSIAIGQGAVSPGESFRPEEAVTFDEAFKILCVLLGYGQAAENAGGYPSGYRALAIRNDIADGIKSISGEVSRLQALVLFENFIKAPFIDEIYSQDKISYRYNGDTILGRVYNAYKVTGIVTGNSTAMFGDENKKISECRIRIDGDEYESIADCDAYLGYRAEAWVCERDGNMCVLGISKKNSESVTLNIGGCEKRDDTSVAYTEDNKIYRIDRSANVVYNGRYVRESFMSMLDKKPVGKMTLIENDGDSSYDVVIIEAPDYMFVKMTDTVDEKIYDTYDNSKLVSLGEDDVRYNVYDLETGEKLKFGSIEPGTVVCVFESADKKLYRFYVNLQSIGGEVTAKNDDGKIEIDGIEYSTSKYFDNNYASSLKIGTKADFTLGINGELVMPNVKGSRFSVGYLINAAPEGNIAKNLKVKIFGTDSEIKVYDCTETVFIDGKKYTDGEKMYEKLLKTADKGQKTAQLIRYSVDENDKIRKLDTYSDATEFYDGDKLPADDRLMRYKFADEYRFRHYGNLCSPYFNSNKAVFFLLPFDRANEDEYRIVSSSYFSDGVYAFVPYNVGLDGGAQYITYETEQKKEGLSNITGDTPCLTVDKVVYMRDKDDNYSPVLRGWSKGKFIEYALDDSIIIKKDSGSTELGFGDICFYEVSNNEITGLQVVFDAAEDVFAPTGKNYFANGSWSTTAFARGKLYYADNGYMYLSNKKNGDGTYDFSFSGLTHITAAQNDVVVMDMKNHEMRPGSLSDLRGYVNAGDDADWIIINYSWLYGYMITVYRGCDA